MHGSTYVGVLGDPAKIDLYSEEFYSLLLGDNSNIIFHLIGASESDVNHEDVNQMYIEFQNILAKESLKPLEILPKPKKIHNHFSSRIGLFPSQRNQVVDGPNFIFAPYPINSKSKYLKIKSKITISLYSKFSSHNVLPLAYSPIGGKAAERAKSYQFDQKQLINQFKGARKNSWFEWFYLEAGSGEKKLKTSTIQEILRVQHEVVNKKLTTQQKRESSNHSRIIVPQSIYGGGIRTKNDIDEILSINDETKYVPQCIILGNISETDVNKTYQLIDRVNELNHQ